jgi:DNA replication and repair protein RecF
MALRRVQVTDFRCLHQVSLDLDPWFTLISGPNASGKTSILEALYVLGRGRSFRTRRLEHLIRTGADRMILFGEAEVSQRHVPVGVEGSVEGLRARVGGERVASLAELTTLLPVQIIDPEVHRLIEEGPSQRRRLLDWGVFHVEQSFVGYWQKYQQALRQRNAALRAGHAAGAISAWDGELLRYGELITDARARYVAALTPIAQAVAGDLLGLELTLSYRTGWARELSLREALSRSWTKDQEALATQVGPQRADLVVRVDGHLARDRISRGQQKLLAGVLLLSQIRLLPQDAARVPTLLLDDPAAELDAQRLGALIRAVQAQPVQLVVTTLHHGLAEFADFGSPGRHYHIDQGHLRAA